MQLLSYIGNEWARCMRFRERKCEHTTWWVGVVMQSDCVCVLLQPHSLGEPDSGRVLGKVKDLPPTFTIQTGRTLHSAALDIDSNCKPRHLPPTAHPFISPSCSLTALSPMHHYLKTQLMFSDLALKYKQTL